MKPRFAIMMLVGLLALGACEPETENAPAPFAMTEDAMGRYCGMNVIEHPGPKGQIILTKYDEPIWFSSVRDTIAFTLLPEEPKDIRAIYVSDMARAASWEDPGADNWIDARQAFFVVGSDRIGGMGTVEAVPFSDEQKAADFARDHGGEVVRFDEVPRDYILGPQAAGDEVSTIAGGDGN